jgi:hypothetical protein
MPYRIHSIIIGIATILLMLELRRKNASPHPFSILTGFIINIELEMDHFQGIASSRRRHSEFARRECD